MLTKAEKFYIDQHASTMIPEEIAKELEVSLRSVKAYCRKLPQQPTDNATAELTELRGKVQLLEKELDKANKKGNENIENKFAVRSGTVSMTESASMDGDIHGEQQSKVNQPFLNARMKNCVHVINPDKPIS